MATRISPPQNKTYYINPAYLTFVENSGYGANLIQVSASSSCYISVYDPANGIGYSDADRNYQRWKVTAYNNKFPNNEKFYIYIRLERSGASALVIYDTVLRGVKGGEITVSKDENGNDVYTEAESTQDTYWYIRIGEVGQTDGASIREITYDTGYLTSDEAINDKTGVDEMWELDKYSTPWLIRAKQWLQSFTVKGFISLLGGLVFKKDDGTEKPVTDIKRSIDSDNEYLLDGDGSIKVDEQGNPIPNPNYVPVSDETLPSTKYLHGKLEGFDDKYLRKDQDDRTAYSLSVGGKTTAEGGLQVGPEFASGLFGYGANIDKKGQAELHSLFIRTFLEVPELRYNRITVRMGDEINSVSAGIVERVEPASNGSSTGTLWLKLEDGEFGSLEVGDLVMQIFSDTMTPSNNADENSDDGKGNRTMKGFATVYFEVISVDGDRNEVISYRLREDARQIHPYAMGPFVQRGNRVNTERQTIIYQGIYPKPYTRYMTGVNQWEFTFTMIGMQLGDLSNLSAFGQNLSGYSAYLNNVYYTGFIFELTPQQKEEISAYSVSLSEYVGSIRVDSEGNIIAGEYTPVNVVTEDKNVITGEENVVTEEYLLQTRVQAFKGEKELAYTSDIPGSGQFTCSISGNGCTAGIANGVISIISVENFEYCSVRVETLCEGKAIFYSTYQVKIIKDGSSALYVDIDNEMDSVACDEFGTVLFGLPVSCEVSAWYGQRQLNINRIELTSPEGVAVTALQGNEGVYTGQVQVTEISQYAADSIKIGIAVYVELFGVEESRNLTFTVNKVKQGESAVLYKLLPSVDSVKVNNEGAPDVAYVSCGVLKVTAKGAVELSVLPEDFTMQYRINKGFFDNYNYQETIPVSEDIQSISFRLFQDSVLIDAETIPVVKDGNAIKQVGEFYLATSYGYGEGVTREDGPWGTWMEGIIPELNEEKRYLWNYEVISYTGIESTYTEPAIIAMWTKDGKGVKVVYEWYQVNDNKDTAPDYPHIEGDAWVRDTAPVMREDAKYLWNYEEVLWTDGSVTYTEPVMIGAKGETGATTPVLSISHAAVSRNSLGAYDPRHVSTSVYRGLEPEVLWISLYGEKSDGKLHFLKSEETSRMQVDLMEYSVLDFKSMTFRAYLEQTNDSNAPYLASVGLTFVQDGEIGENGPMPRNMGKYDGSTPYYYNSEYRDYTWDTSGNVYLRKGRGESYAPEGKEEIEGAIIGYQPTSDEDNPYWVVASRMALTAIDTALIDEANIAGFMFKDGLLVSQENDPRNLKANIILDGSTGKLKCNDAEVKGLITVGNIEYDIQSRSDGSLVESAMVIGPGEFILPLIKEGYTTEIKAIYPTVESRAALPSFKFGHSQAEVESILFYDKNSRWWKYYSVVELEPNILYTFVSYNDNGTYRWMLTTSTGEGAPGSAPIVDSQLDINSTNPIQNKVVTGEIERIGPVVYDASLKYWKLDGDLLVTGGIASHSSDTAFTPSTVMDAIQVDWQTLVIENRVLKINPDVELGGGAASWDELRGKPSWITTTKPVYDYSEIENTPTSLRNPYSLSWSGYNSGSYNGSSTASFYIPENTSDLYNDSGFITSVTKSMVTTALGFTPYNSTNPNGYITSSGSITGNAATATKLATARTISLTGHVTGFGSFDGSVDLSITTAIPTRNVVINGTSWTVHSTITTDTTGIYAPTSGGTSGYVLKSNGSTSVPTWIAQSSLSVGSATTASKLSTVSKTAWGQTYWTSGGVPTTISGDMTGVGNITMSGKLYVANAQGIYISNVSGTYNIVMSIDGSNNLCIGTGSAASGYATYLDGNTTIFRTSTTRTERMRITTNGNIGIGTTSPSYQLHATGTIYGSANVYTSGIFQVISSGSYARTRYFCDSTSTYATGGAVFIQAGNYAGSTRSGSLMFSGINVADLALCKIYGPLLVTSGISSHSDIRKKTKLQDVELSLKEIADAPLIEHYYNSDKFKTTHVSSIAQYWASLNDWFCKKDNEGFYTMELQNAALASAISVARHLERYENKTDKTIRQLKKRISQLEDEIELLKKGE